MFRRKRDSDVDEIRDLFLSIFKYDFCTFRSTLYLKINPFELFCRLQNGPCIALELRLSLHLHEAYIEKFCHSAYVILKNRKEFYTKELSCTDKKYTSFRNLTIAIASIQMDATSDGTFHDVRLFVLPFYQLSNDLKLRIVKINT